MKKIPRKYRDDNVAILYSPGYGAGWSTWNDDKLREGLLYHKELIEMVEAGKRTKITQKKVQELLGLDKDTYVCVCGNDQLEVQYIPKRTLFRIETYDGNESIEIYNTNSYEVAE
jgi:uncharacterized protein